MSTDTEGDTIDLLVPIQGPVSATWSIGLKRLNFPSGMKVEFSKGLPIDRQRESLVEGVMTDEHYDDVSHVLFMDSDVVPQDPNALQRLLARELPIVSGLYWSKNGEPCAWDIDDGVKDNWGLDELDSQTPQPVDVFGLGFCLIETRPSRLLMRQPSNRSINR